jgi:hypothetical protein
MWQYTIGQESPSYIHIFWLWTILHLLNTFMQVPDHWLAEPHNSHSSMSHNMKAGHSIQLVMSGNLHVCAGYLVDVT